MYHRTNATGERAMGPLDIRGRAEARPSKVIIFYMSFRRNPESMLHGYLDSGSSLRCFRNDLLFLVIRGEPPLIPLRIRRNRYLVGAVTGRE